MPRAASLLGLSAALLPVAHGLSGTGERPAVVAPAHEPAKKGRTASELQVAWTPEADLVDISLDSIKPSEAMHMMDPKMAALIVKKVLNPLAHMDVQDDEGRTAGDTAERLIEAREDAAERHREREEAEEAGREATKKQKRHHHHHHHHHHHKQEDDEQQQEEQQEQAGQNEQEETTNTQAEQLPESDQANDQPETQPEKPHKRHHHHHHHHKTEDVEEPAQAKSKATLIRIAPTLTPTSDQKVFGKDHPSGELPGTHRQAEAKEAAAKASVEKVKAQVATEKTQHDQALKVYEAEKKEAGKITEDLSNAEERLKKLRSGEGSPGMQPKEGGGAQPASFFHGSAARVRSAAAPLLLAVLVAAASAA